MRGQPGALRGLSLTLRHPELFDVKALHISPSWTDKAALRNRSCLPTSFATKIAKRLHKVTEPKHRPHNYYARFKMNLHFLRPSTTTPFPWPQSARWRGGSRRIPNSLVDFHAARRIQDEPSLSPDRRRRVSTYVANDAKTTQRLVLTQPQPPLVDGRRRAHLEARRRGALLPRPGARYDPFRCRPRVGGGDGARGPQEPAPRGEAQGRRAGRRPGPDLSRVLEKFLAAALAKIRERHAQSLVLDDAESLRAALRGANCSGLVEYRQVAGPEDTQLGLHKAIERRVDLVVPLPAAKVVRRRRGPRVRGARQLYLTT